AASFEKTAQQAPADASASVRRQQRNVYQCGGAFAPVNNHSADGRGLEQYDLLFGSGIGRCIPLLLGRKLHPQECFQLSSAPTQCRKLFLSSTGVELKKKFLVAGKKRPQRDRHAKQR